MRTYEKEQQNSVMFEDDKAEKIIELRQEMDIEAERICKELHSAYDKAEQEFKQLGVEYQSQFEKLFKGTPLAGVPLSQIGLNYSYGDQHGVVFAKKVERDPLETFLNILRKATDNGPTVTEDSIIFESTQPSLQERWGASSRQSQRETENV